MTPADPAKLSYEQWQKRRNCRAGSGRRGGLPHFSERIRCGGLTIDDAIVIEKELSEYDVSLPSL